MEIKKPIDWKNVIIIPVYIKKVTKYTVKSNNYRGISLLNTAFKVFSKILLQGLQQITEKFIGEYQISFRENYSTTDP